MNQAPTAQRQTKYCYAIEHELKKLGHATNAELLTRLQISYPSLSATTVHRATERLSRRGIISTAPLDKNGSIRYDSNVKPHDHFLCSSCGQLRDTDVKDDVIPILESAINGCRISGQLTISGICKNCIRKETI